MPECGNIEGAYSTQDVNVGWYGYRTSRASNLRVGPGDHFRVIEHVAAGKRIGVQSTRNPKVVDNPPKRPTRTGPNGAHWAWVYVADTGHVGWMKVSHLEEHKSLIPWAHGPGGKDFHVGMEKARKGPSSSCHGRRRNKVRIVDVKRARLRYAPASTAYHWLEEGDSVRELFRRSLDDYTAVVVVKSQSAPEGARGWIKVTSLSGEKVTGIDVSNHQGKVDFFKVRANGERFVICKATEGEGFIDPTFHSNVRSARAAGLEVGAYHFLRPRIGRSGRDEADDFVRVLRAAHLGKGDIRPTVDIETTAIGANATEIYVGQFIGSLRMAGFDAMLYTFPAFMEWHRTFDTDLWIAHFGVRRPTVPNPWKSYAIWQYTSSGKVPGVSGNVDRNKCPDLSRIIQR